MQPATFQFGIADFAVRRYDENPDTFQSVIKRGSVGHAKRSGMWAVKSGSPVGPMPSRILAPDSDDDVPSSQPVNAPSVAPRRIVRSPKKESVKEDILPMGKYTSVSDLEKIIEDVPTSWEVTTVTKPITETSLITREESMHAKVRRIIDTHYARIPLSDDEESFETWPSSILPSEEEMHEILEKSANFQHALASKRAGVYLPEPDFTSMDSDHDESIGEQWIRVHAPEVVDDNNNAITFNHDYSYLCGEDSS